MTDLLIYGMDGKTRKGITFNLRNKTIHSDKDINLSDLYSIAIKEWKGTIRKDREPLAIFNEDGLQYPPPKEYRPWTIENPSFLTKVDNPCPICEMEKKSAEFIKESEMTL
jgi:hypothetical protein